MGVITDSERFQSCYSEQLYFTTFQIKETQHFKRETFKMQLFCPRCGILVQIRQKVAVDVLQGSLSIRNKDFQIHFSLYSRHLVLK